jgi:hypothetical protein
MALGETLGSIVGGFLGNNAAASDRGNAKDFIKQSLKYYKDLGEAPDTSRALLLQQFEQAGILTPELEQELDLAQSEFENINLDPQTRDMQLEALNRFKQSAETGMGPEERAAYNQMLQGVRQDTRAKQDQILQDAQRRGQGGGGAELIAQLQAAQSGADQASAGADQLAALVAQRVRQGAQDMSQAAGDLRNQDYGIASDKARALDARNQFMYTNSTARQQRNIAAKNAAQAANLVNAQDIANKNVGQANEELRRQQEAKRLQYGQNLDRIGDMSGAAQTVSNYYANSAAQKAAAQKEMGKGIGGMFDSGVDTFQAAPKDASTLATIGAMFSDERVKEDISYDDREMEDFLNSLEPASYNYKPEVQNSPLASKERQIGVMAQDLEKSKMGNESVRDTSAGKIVNYDEMGPKMLAAIAYLNKKIKRFEGQ